MSVFVFNFSFKLFLNCHKVFEKFCLARNNSTILQIKLFCIQIVVGRHRRFFEKETDKGFQVILLDQFIHVSLFARIISRFLLDVYIFYIVSDFFQAILLELEFHKILCITSNLSIINSGKWYKTNFSSRWSWLNSSWKQCIMD